MQQDRAGVEYDRRGVIVNEYLLDYRGIPTVTFTIPPLSSVGLTEEQAKERAEKGGLEYNVKMSETSGWYTSRRIETFNLSANSLKHMAFSYPTASSDIAYML